MANANNIQFGIKFNVDKNGLIQALKPLQQMGDYIQKMNAKKAPNAGQLAQQLGIREAAKAAKQLQKIINGSWNDKLNQLNLGKFNLSIKQSFGSVENLRKSLLKGREDGQQAFDAIASSVLNTNVQLRNANGFLDSMAKTMANTVKWGISSKIFNNLTGSIQQAYYYTKDLDRELTSIRVVTGQSADQMARFADMANRSAKNLGRSTLDYTKAALGYYQQGLDTQQVQARTEVTLKAENITGAGSQMVDYLTSVWNGFQIDTSSIQDAEAAVDKMAAVADSSASNMSQLALAMSKVAATANLMGVDMDSLVAQLATVIATTRQAPEAVGTAFKTIYTRLNDIKTGADEAQISLGNYSGQMASLGFNVLDANGRLRDTGDVIEEIGSRWNTLSKEQQTYLARIMGGQRQITQVIALFDNWTRYSELLNTSLEAQGTLDEKNSIYLESLQGHLQKLGTEAQRTYQIFSDNDALKGITDAFTGVLNIFNDFIQGLGGGRSTILAFGAIVANVFNKQIADGLLKVNGELQRFVNNFQSKALQKKFIEDLTKNANASQNQTVEGRALQIQAKQMQQVLKVSKGLTNENYQQAISLTRKIALAEEEKRLLEQQAAASRIRTNEQDKLLRTISVNNASQEDQLKTLNAQIENRKKQNDIYANLQANVRRLKKLELQNLTSGQRQSEIYQLLTKNRKELVNAITTQVGEETKANALIDEIINKINRGEDVTQDLNSILGTITGKLNINREQLQIALGLQRKMTDASGQQAQKRDDLINKDRSRLELLKQQAKTTINVQNFVKIASAIAMATPSLINFFDTWADGTKTAQEKALAFSSTVTTTIGGLGSFLSTMPSMTAKAVGIGLQIASPILGQLAKKTQDWFKTTQEKIEEFEQKVQQVNKNYSEKGKQITSLQKISEEWNILSEKAGRYGKNVDLMSQEQQDRYYELIDTFAQYNDKVIAGYDAQGRAIIANNNVLKETIDLLKDQQWEEFTKNFGSIDKYYQNQQLLINQKQSKSENIFDSYENAVSNYGGGRKANAYERFLSNYDFINDDKVHDFLKNSGDFKYIEGKDSFKFLPETRNYLALMAPNEENFEKWKEEFLNFLTDQYNQMVKQGIFLDAENVPKLEDFQNYMLKNFFGTSDFDLESALEEFNIADPQMAALIARKKYQSFFKSLSYESEQAIYTGLQQYLNSLNKTEKGIIQTQDYEDYSKNYIEGIQDFIEKTSIDYGKINQSLEKKREQAKKLGKKFTQENEKDFIEQQVLSKIDESYWESLSPEIKDSIQAFLGSVFHYRSFEIDFSADKAQISKKSSTELKSQIAEAYQDFFAKKGQIYNIGLEKGAFRTDAISKTGFYDELAKYLDPQQLMDFDNIVNRIDWSKLSGLDTDKLGDQLRKQAQEIARQINEELNESLFTMSITEITDSKDIAEALLKPDELKKAQREVLDQILAGDEQLKSIYDKYGERSSQFIQALNARSINSIAIYEQHWKNVKNQTQDNIIEIEDSINKIFDNTRINTSGLESIIFGDKGQLLENININSLQEQAEAARKAGDKDTADLYQQIISLIQQRNEELQKGIQADNESARAVAARRAQEEAIAKAAKEQADAKKELQKKQEAEAREEDRTEATSARDALLTGQEKISQKDFKITSADSDWVYALVDNDDQLSNLAKNSGGIYSEAFLEGLKEWFSNESNVQEAFTNFNSIVEKTLNDDLQAAQKNKKDFINDWWSEDSVNERLKDTGYNYNDYQAALQIKNSSAWNYVPEDAQQRYNDIILLAEQRSEYDAKIAKYNEDEQKATETIKENTRQTAQNQQKSLETKQKQTIEDLKQLQIQKDKEHQENLKNNAKDRQNLAKREEALEKVEDLYKKYLDPDQFLEQPDYQSLDLLRSLFSPEDKKAIEKQYKETGNLYGDAFWTAIENVSKNKGSLFKQVNDNFLQDLKDDAKELEKQYNETEQNLIKQSLTGTKYTYEDYQRIKKASQNSDDWGDLTQEERDFYGIIQTILNKNEDLKKIKQEQLETEEKITEETRDQSAETAARAEAEKQATAERQKILDEQAEKRRQNKRQQDAELKEALEGARKEYNKLAHLEEGDIDIGILTTLQKQYPALAAAAKQQGGRTGQAYLNALLNVIELAPGKITQIIQSTSDSYQAEIDKTKETRDRNIQATGTTYSAEQIVNAKNIIDNGQEGTQEYAMALAAWNTLGDTGQRQFITDQEAVIQATENLNNYKNQQIKINNTLLKQQKQMYSSQLAISGTRTVSDALRNQKALTEEQDKFLDKLEEENEVLKDLAGEYGEGRYNPEYIKLLQEQSDEAIEIYKGQLDKKVSLAKSIASNAEALVNSAISDALNQDSFKELNITSLEELEQALENSEEGLSLPPEIIEAYQKFLQAQEAVNDAERDSINFDKQQAESKKELTQAVKEATKAREEYNRKVAAEQREEDRSKAKETRDALLEGQSEVFEADFKITTSNDDWVRTLLEGMDENDPLVVAAGENFANIYSDGFLVELLKFFSDSSRFSGLLDTLNNSIIESLNKDVADAQKTLTDKYTQLNSVENITNRLSKNKGNYTFDQYLDAVRQANKNDDLENLVFQYSQKELSKEDFLEKWKSAGGGIESGNILAEAYNYLEEESAQLEDLTDKVQDNQEKVTDETKQQAENLQVMAETEKQIAQSAKQRAEAQRQAAKARAEQQMSAGANAQSALQKMQTSKPGQYELTSDEGTALAFYEREVPELAKLQQGSREYQQLLAEILATRTDLVEKAKEERLAILEAEKQELLAEQEKNKAKLEQIELDKQAQLGIINGAGYTGQEKIAAQAQLIILQNQQANIVAEIASTDDQILAKQGEIAEAESTRVDYLQTAAEKATEFNELMSKVLSSGIQMGSADQGRIVVLMDSLIQKYPELTKQAEILKQTWMAGTQQYADALRDVSQAMNDIALSEVIDKIDEEFPQFDISFIPDTDQVDAWIADLEKYLDADKELLIQVKTNADAAFEQVSGEMQRIYEAASKIGQNFIVAAKDIDVLRQTFPGILEGMQLLSDGSYQLNAQMVQDAMGTADATIQASVQSAQAQIQEQAQVAKQKATSFRSMAFMARALAENEGENAEASAYIQKQLSAQVSHNKALNSKLTAQQEATNDKTVTDSQTENASLVANANVSAYQAAAEANYQYTQQVLENNKAIASSMPLGPITGFTDTGGGGGTAVKKDITNLYKSPEQAKDVTGLLKDDNELLSALEDALNQTDPGERTKALLSNADNMDTQAAMWEALYQQLEAQKDALGSQYEALKQGLDNVARGVGFDPSKNKGGSGGGGKGSTPKEKTQKKPDKMDLLDEDVDRYHDINKQLKEIERTLSKVQNEQKKLFGKDLIDNLNKQLKILEQQIEKQKEKAEIAKQEQEELRSTLNKQGVQFDSQGNINNYTKILEEKEKAVNAQIEKYNNMTKEEQQAQKQVVNQAKKEFEKFKKNIQKYENAQEIVQQSEENIQKALDKEIQIKISKFKMGIEIELQLGEATRQWNAFRKKVIDRINERNTRGQVQAQMADFSSYYYMRKDPGTGREHLAGQIPAATTQVQNTLQELRTMQDGGISTFYGNNVAAAMEDLKKYNDKLQEGLMAVEDIQQNIHQSVLSAIDAAKSAMDSVRSDFELISNQLDHDLKLMQMIYGEKNYEMNNDYLTRQQEINNKNLESLQKEKDIWQKLVLSSREKLSGLTEGSDEYYKELDNYTKYRDNFTNVVNQINDGIAKGVELAQAKYENNVNQSLNDLEKRMTGGKGLKQLKEEWEYLNEEADRYLDKVNGMYEVNSLENSIKKAIKGYDGNIKAQQALNKLGDELLTQLREKDKLTQYDVDRANALLEIQQKRLALQDIRNNKTQLRLRRDTQGNYTFQYTANQEQTTDAEQELLTAKNRLYNLDKNAEKQEMENYIKDTQNYINRVKQFYDQGAEYALAHKDEEQRIRQHYQGLITQDVQREETARQQLQETTYQSLVQGYQEYGNSMEQAVKIAQQIMGGDDNAQVPYTWRLGLDQMKEEITKDGGLQQVTEDVFINKLPAAVDKFEQSIRNLEQASGISFEQIKDGADSVIDTLDMILDTDSQIADYNSDLMSNTQELAETAKMMMESYQDAAEAAKQAAAAAWDYWSAEQEIAADQAAKQVKKEQNRSSNRKYDPNLDNAWAGNLLENWDDTDFNKDFNENGVGAVIEEYIQDAPKPTWDRVKAVYDLINEGKVGNDPERKNILRNRPEKFTDAEIEMGQKLINYAYPRSLRGYGYGFEEGKRLLGYLTGGYTGDWAGSNGKLALLHQKELVLNASDTQNILAAVDIARTISDLLQTINGDTGMTGLFNMLKPQNQANPQLDQNVKIEAHFPNVTNSDEIERAFDNLVNQASQYAFKLH